MPDFDLSTLSGPELRGLLDSTRQRGQAAQSYRILQEIDMNGSTKTSVVRDGGHFFPNLPRLERLTKGGRFGKLVVPQGFLILVLPSFEKLAPVYRLELEQAFEEMSRITISKGKLVLDPRADGGSALPPAGGTF